MIIHNNNEEMIDAWQNRLREYSQKNLKRSDMYFPPGHPSRFRPEWTFAVKLVEHFVPMLIDWSLSDRYIVQPSSNQTYKDVCFCTMEHPTDIIDGKAVTSMSRKVRATINFESNGETIVSEDTFLCEIAKEIATEIQLEIRNNSPIKFYAVYVPPHPTTTVMSPSTFTFRRSMLMRYAKV